MADCSSPKPVDPIWYQPGAWLNIQCGCGRNENYSLREFARVSLLNKNMLLHRLIKRLRCMKCGERPRFADVTRYKGRSRTFACGHRCGPVEEFGGMSACETVIYAEDF